LAFIVVFAASCDDSSTGVDAEPELKVHLVENLSANADAERGTGPDFTFYSIRENTIIADVDSATSKWDIAFSELRVIVNSGASGPGKGGAVVLDVPFNEVEIAPEADEYNVDSEGCA